MGRRSAGGGLGRVLRVGVGARSGGTGCVAGATTPARKHTAAPTPAPTPTSPGGREDLVAKEKAELALLESYLPPQLGEEELRTIVAAAVAEAGGGGGGAKAMGAVMKIVQAKAAGRADNKAVSALVKEALAG